MIENQTALERYTKFYKESAYLGRHSLLATSTVSCQLYASRVELGETAARKLIPLSNDAVYRRTADAVSDIMENSIQRLGPV